MTEPAEFLACGRCENPTPLLRWSESFGCYACDDCHPDTSMVARVEAAVLRAEREARRRAEGRGA
jgi:hypothetical protein